MYEIFREGGMGKRNRYFARNPMTKGVLQDLTLEEGDGQGEELESDIRWFLFTARCSRVV